MASLTLRLLLAVMALTGRKKGLKKLFRLTATACGRETPDMRGQSRREMLRRYATFTRCEAEKAIAGGTTAGVRKNLYESSLRLGRDIRRQLRVRSRADAAAALHCLYGMISIDKTVDARGEVTVKSCSFATVYTPEICRFVSAMDEGLVAGICSGRLVFSQRLTEGADSCRGRIEWRERDE